MTRRIFYHTDHDGEASGAIAYNWANTVATPYQACVLYPITYGKPFPFDQIHEGDSVYILDYSIPPADMKKLLAITPNVVWIDHHKTAIEEYSYHPEIGEIAGIRDTDEAGCVLTWAFFNGRGVIPLPIVLIGDRDVWRFAYGDDTRNFCMGLHMYNTEPSDKMWPRLFGEAGKSMVYEMQKEGKIATQYRDSWAKSYSKSWGYDATIDGFGDVKCFVMNLGRCGSEFFGDRIKEYDVCASVGFNGSMWEVSFYSEKIDVSVIAKKFGGGGHTGASGAVVAGLPFKKITE